MPGIRRTLATLAVAALAASATAGAASAQTRHHHPRHHHHIVCLQPGGPVFPGHPAMPLRCVTVAVPVSR